MEIDEKMERDRLAEVDRQNGIRPITGQPVECRKAFEGWFCDGNIDNMPPHDDKRYIHNDVEFGWKAWQAAWDAVSARLPEGMRHCTILFKECEKGHGRLTATNWIDHGCQQCTIESLRSTEQEEGQPVDSLHDEFMSNPISDIKDCLQVVMARIEGERFTPFGLLSSCQYKQEDQAAYRLASVVQCARFDGYKAARATMREAVTLERTQRRVVCAAIRIGDLIVAGVRHFDMVMHGQIKVMPSLADGDGYVSAVQEAEQGFVDQRGEFMDRIEALAVAEAAGQLRGEKCNPKHWLFSEDLY